MEQSKISSGNAVDRAMKPFALPIGLASPMWLAYGAATSLSATWWWMSRMTRFAAPKPVETPAPAEIVAQTVVAPLAEPVAVVTEALPVTETAAEPRQPTATVVEATPPVAEIAAVPSMEQPDELTLLRGVGPRVADALVARGVTTFAQLAAWTDDDMATFDRDLKLLGRSTRYDFLGQARQLASGG